MLHFLSRRALHGLGLLFVVSMICFVLIHAPEGDYASQAKAVAISQYGMSEAAAETYAQHLRERLGLDQPLLLQYLAMRPPACWRFWARPSPDSCWR